MEEVEKLTFLIFDQEFPKFDFQLWRQFLIEFIFFDLSKIKIVLYVCQLIEVSHFFEQDFMDVLQIIMIDDIPHHPILHDLSLLHRRYLFRFETKNAVDATGELRKQHRPEKNKDL